MIMSKAEAGVELTILDSKAQALDRVDTLTRFTNAGLPQEVVLRLQEVWDAREVIAGRVIHVGKIVFMEMNRFVDANPNLAFGVALGAAAGALTSLIPGIGPLIAPFAMAAGILIGALAGQALDRGTRATNPVMEVTQDLISLARKFFELLASIFNALLPQTAGT